MTRSRRQTRPSSRSLASTALVGLALIGTACSSTPERAPAVPEVEPMQFVSQADLTASEADAIFLREEASRRTNWELAQARVPTRSDPAPVAPMAEPAPRVEFEDLAPAAPAGDPMAPTFGPSRSLDTGTAVPTSGLRRAAASPRPESIPASSAPLRAAPSTMPEPVVPTPEGSTPAPPMRNFRDLYRNGGPPATPEPASRTRRITLAEEADQLRAVAQSGEPVQSRPDPIRLQPASSTGFGRSTRQIGWHGAREAARRGPAVDGRQGVMMDLLLGDRNRIRVH